MTSHNRCAILIVTHNHARYVDALLASLTDQKYTNVYICDAASTDGTLEKLNRSTFRLLSKSTVEGFSKNNNDLLKEFNIDAEYIILLNPDTYFETDIVSELVEFMDDHPRAAIAAPRLLFPNGRYQITWKRFPNLLSAFLKRLGITGDHRAYDNRTQKIDWAIGAALIVRSKYMLDQGKLLDERYRLYCEDSDLCLSAHHKGYEVWGVIETVIYHHLNEKSTKKIVGLYNLINIQSLVKFITKWNFIYLRYLIGMK